jgi:hypothetical protein
MIRKKSLLDREGKKKKKKNLTCQIERCKARRFCIVG